VVFLAIDDLRALLGSYGSQLVRTPNIDRLASRGTVFTKAYCNWPVCGPSRASALTGLRPEAVGVLDLQTDMRLKDPNVLSLPQHFKQHGYITGGAGKIFDTRNVDNAKDCDKPSWTVPFDTYGSTSRLWPAPETKQRMYEEMLRQGNVYNERHWGTNASLVLSPDCRNEDLPDGQITEAGLKLMRSLAADQRSSPATASPFFLAIGLNKPHLPFWAPKRFWDMYDLSALPSVGAQYEVLHDSGYAVHGSFEFRDYFPVPTAEPIPHALQQKAFHGYLACVSYVDELVGEITKQLDDLALTETTTIVLWGDHGFHLGDNGMWGKHSTLENSARVPLIIVPPGGSAARYVDSPVELVDIFPTLCTLSGLPVPSQLHGRSLQPLLAGARSAVREGSLTINDAWPGRSGWSKAPVNAIGYSYRTARYRLTQWVGYRDRSSHRNAANWSDRLARFTPTGEIVGVDLFDYELDPGETANIAQQASSADLVRQLSAGLRRHCEGCERLFAVGGQT